MTAIARSIGPAGLNLRPVLDWSGIAKLVPENEAQLFAVVKCWKNQRSSIKEAMVVGDEIAPQFARRWQLLEHIVHRHQLRIVADG